MPADALSYSTPQSPYKWPRKLSAAAHLPPEARRSKGVKKMKGQCVKNVVHARNAAKKAARG
jgi:hypothetical protein